jgi:hypothetical protein
VLKAVGEQPGAGKQIGFYLPACVSGDSGGKIVPAREGWAMKVDHDRVDEMVLALLYLTVWEEDACGGRAWKSHDWDALDRLHAKGYIEDPRNKAKSVVLRPEGLARARELFERHFTRPDGRN